MLYIIEHVKVGANERKQFVLIRATKNMRRLAARVGTSMLIN